MIIKIIYVSIPFLLLYICSLEIDEGIPFPWNPVSDPQTPYRAQDELEMVGETKVIRELLFQAHPTGCGWKWSGFANKNEEFKPYIAINMVDLPWKDEDVTGRGVDIMVITQKNRNRYRDSVDSDSLPNSWGCGRQNDFFFSQQIMGQGAGYGGDWFLFAVLYQRGMMKGRTYRTKTY